MKVFLLTEIEKCSNKSSNIKYIIKLDLKYKTIFNESVFVDRHGTMSTKVSGPSRPPRSRTISATSVYGFTLKGTKPKNGKT